jgi:hypothetical protein
LVVINACRARELRRRFEEIFHRSIGIDTGEVKVCPFTEHGNGARGRGHVDSAFVGAQHKTIRWGEDGFVISAADADDPQGAFDSIARTIALSDRTRGGPEAPLVNA